MRALHSGPSRLRTPADSAEEVVMVPDEEIDHGYDAAVADILDNWEENRRRYLHD
jgi:hypothetical protein